MTYNVRMAILAISDWDSGNFLDSIRESLRIQQKRPNHSLSVGFYCKKKPATANIWKDWTVWWPGKCFFLIFHVWTPEPANEWRIYKALKTTMLRRERVEFDWTNFTHYPVEVNVFVLNVEYNRLPMNVAPVLQWCWVGASIKDNVVRFGDI